MAQHPAAVGSSGCHVDCHSVFLISVLPCFPWRAPCCLWSGFILCYILLMLSLLISTPKLLVRGLVALASSVSIVHFNFGHMWILCCAACASFIKLIWMGTRNRKDMQTGICQRNRIRSGRSGMESKHEGLRGTHSKNGQWNRKLRRPRKMVTSVVLWIPPQGFSFGGPFLFCHPFTPSTISSQPFDSGFHFSSNSCPILHAGLCLLRDLSGHEPHCT